MTNIKQGLLHRAFSVFLFRPSDGKLLLQKRADEKITFPSMWTNTCCSHPLYIKSELVDENQQGASERHQVNLELTCKVPKLPLSVNSTTSLAFRQNSSRSTTSPSSRVSTTSPRRTVSGESTRVSG